MWLIFALLFAPSAPMGGLVFADTPIAETPFAKGHLRRRSDFRQSQQRFTKQQKGRVAFIGGSITAGGGFRTMMEAYLKKRFPQTEFEFINAGISSTCSTTGAFRLEADVFAGGPVDLLFVEFAVNDDQDAMHSRKRCIRGMEGILRRVRTDHPNTELVVTYFINPGMLKQIQSQQTKAPAERQLPRPMSAHEQVAAHYDVSTVLLASEVAARIKAGSLTWAQYGGTHPKPQGHRIAADMLIAMLEEGWNSETSDRTAKSDVPKPIDPKSYDHGMWVVPERSQLGEGWKLEQPDWAELKGQCREKFRKRRLLVADQPGSQTVVSFEGRALGAFVLAGPDAGQIEVSIDGSDWRTVELYHRFSKGLHYPRTVIFDDELTPGPHRAVIRVGAKRHASSQGHAVRILSLAVNAARSDKAE